MSKEKKQHHEQLVRISKRDQMVFWKSWLVRLAAIVLALILCAFVIVLITGYNPLEVYSSMWSGTFGSVRKVWLTLQKTAMLLCISLAVTPAYKMRFWNIGAEGQVLIGCLATAACMIYFGESMPPALLFPVMFLASVAAGAIWAMIPAVFRAKWGTNETLFTLMMNYVAMQLVSYFITFWENPAGSNSVGIINSMSKGGWLPELFGQKYLLNILIVAVLTVLMFIYLKYSKQGYELTVVGESENTARYIGINIKKVIIRTLLISGAICGIAGFMLVAGTDHTISTNTVGGMGFTAIMVSWLAKFNPIVMTLASFLLTFLSRGAGEIATALRLNQSVSDILTGIILFFIIGCEFFINYKVTFHFRARSHKKEVRE
ncbi:MAG: ABC transporter permease [Clostridiaceae bacterium]|nr:ABC transporter permease [Clostridiaceae bacterium]